MTLLAAGLAARSAAEAPPAPVIRTSLALVGIVLPRDVAPEDRYCATVVTDVESYASVPGLRVVEVVAPLSDGASGRPSLDGLFVECGSGRAEPASGVLSCSAPGEGSDLVFSLVRQPGGVPVARASVPAVRRSEPSPASFAAPPISVAGAVQVIEGPFESGGEAARLEIGGRPAPVIAVSPRALYWGLPPGTPEGRNLAILRTGSRSVALPIWVVRLALTADRLNLERGESTGFHVVLSGLVSLPESAWRAGLATGLVDSDRLARLAPGFRAPEPGGWGVILLAIENGSPDAIALEGSTDQRIVVPVSRGDVRDGAFRYDGVIRSRRAGPFAVSAAVLPLLSAVPGEDSPATRVSSRGPGPLP